MPVHLSWNSQTWDADKQQTTVLLFKILQSSPDSWVPLGRPRKIQLFIRKFFYNPTHGAGLWVASSLALAMMTTMYMT